MAKKTKKQTQRDERIYQLTTLVAGDFSLQEALDKLAEAAVKITEVKACSIRLLDEQADQLEMRSTYGLSDQYRSKGPVTKNDTVVKAAFAGQAVVLDDMRVDGRVKYRQATVDEGLVSQLTVAMQFRGNNIGVLRLYSPRSKRFSEDDINLARAVASQCAAAITNARLYAKAIEGARIAEQIRLAGVVQRRMIPQKAPQIPSLDIAATYIPCFEVGGDLYDFFQTEDGKVVIGIADVIGKGIPAAMMMSQFRGAIRAYADIKTDDSPIETITRLNKMACSQCKDGEFITLFFAFIDTRKKTLTYCNCGHEPTLLIRNDKFTDLEKGGLVLGIDPKAEYEFETIQLKDDDFLLFYTDGLIDAANFQGRFWTRESLLKTAVKFTDGSAERMVKSILQYRRRFVGLAEQFDDTSIVVVKINPDTRQEV